MGLRIMLSDVHFSMYISPVDGIALHCGRVHKEPFYFLPVSEAVSETFLQESVAWLLFRSYGAVWMIQILQHL